MNNINSLLKKADIYERLAVFGGRRAFLNSLGQATDSFEQAKAALSEAKVFLKEDLFSSLDQKWYKWADWYAGVRDDLLSPPSDLADAKKQLTMLNKIQSALHVGKGPDTTGITKHLLDAEKAIGSYDPSVETSGSNSVNHPERLDDFYGNLGKKDNRTDKSNFSYDTSIPTSEIKVDPKAQQALNKLFGIQLKLDGIMGPQTATALQMYKNKYNSPKNTRDPSIQQDVINTAQSA